MDRSADANGAGRRAADPPARTPSSAGANGARSSDVNALETAVLAFLGAQRRLSWRARSNRMASPERIQVLVLLAQGETTHGELRKQVQMNPARLSALTDEWEQRRLIRRRQDTRDKRVWLISLTPKGQAKVKQIHDEWAAQIAGALADVSDRDIRAARRVLEKLTTVVDSV